MTTTSTGAVVSTCTALDANTSTYRCTIAADSSVETYDDTDTLLSTCNAPYDANGNYTCTDAITGEVTAYDVNNLEHFCYSVYDTTYCEIDADGTAYILEGQAQIATCDAPDVNASLSIKRQVTVMIISQLHES